MPRVYKTRRDLRIIRKDFIGKRYGRLTVIKFSHWKPQKHCSNRSMWLCKCKCGKELIVRGDSLTNKNTRSCGCYTKEITIKNNKKRKLPPGVTAFNALFGKYKWEAKQRYLEWNLTNKQFKKLVKSNCEYCGIEPLQKSITKTSIFLYNGLDRVNNKKGYTYKNVVPCCYFCNSAKRERSLTQFKKWLNRLTNKNVLDNTIFKPFYLYRKIDVSGTSGVGLVALGIQFPSGRCVMEWLGKYQTDTIFKNLQSVIDIHGHNGATDVIVGLPPKKLLTKKNK